MAEMTDNDIYQKLPDALLPWYADNQRELHWRKDRDPYHIWISEIMLQQTRVEAVRWYYDRFLKALPTVLDLAQAPQEQLNKLWEGLGYYCRVRNLKKAAVMIRDKFAGIFPETYEDVLSLPGIGPYTAGAICSIAFNLPVAAVDGNVLRVVSRLTNDDTPIDAPAYKKQVESLLNAVYPEDAGAITQALMELGATVCGPNRLPDCPSCPCLSFCKGYALGTAPSLPKKQPKRPKQHEDKTVLIFRCGDHFALQKRDNSGLLAGLWQFPNVDGLFSATEALQIAEKFGLKPLNLVMSIERKHIFTHIVWNMRGIYMDVAEQSGDFIWKDAVSIAQQAALPTAFRQFWDEIISHYLVK